MRAFIFCTIFTVTAVIAAGTNTGNEQEIYSNKEARATIPKIHRRGGRPPAHKFAECVNGCMRAYEDLFPDYDERVNHCKSACTMDL